MSTRIIVHGAPPAEPPKKRRIRVPKANEISLTDLVNKHLLLLYRETRHLLVESTTGKLSKDSSTAMRENIRLLMEMKKKEKDLLDTLSNDELDALIKQKAAV